MSTKIFQSNEEIRQFVVESCTDALDQVLGPLREQFDDIQKLKERVEFIENEAERLSRDISKLEGKIK